MTLVLLLPFVLLPTCSASYVRATVKQGELRGQTLSILGTTVEAYTGIPYAQPPVGELRFKKPVPLDKWEGIHDATEWDVACMQAPLTNFGDKVYRYTEDCLLLNVWTPGKDGPLKPVLVWIHGGGFNYASSAKNTFNCSVIAAVQELVVVSMNYRLGIFGFLDADIPEAPGNMGLFDQSLALHWVQENIFYLGGDPSKVTIAGESAGSMSVHNHILSPVSRGLFHRAFMMSGTMYTIDFIDTTHESVIKGNSVARAVGCATELKDLANSASDVLSCLRSKTAEELSVASLEMLSPRIFVFLPTFHNEFLPKRPISAIQHGNFANVDVVAGVVTDEGAFAAVFPFREEVMNEDLSDIGEEPLKMFLRLMVGSWMKYDIPDMMDHYDERAHGDKQQLRKMNVERLSDREFNCPTLQFAKHHAARGNDVHLYIYGHRSQKSPYPRWMGVPHSSEIPYFLGSPLVDAENSTDDDRKMSKLMTDVLGNFARNGTAVLEGEDWPPFTADNHLMINMQLTNRTKVSSYRQEHCKLWETYF